MSRARESRDSIAPPVEPSGFGATVLGNGYAVAPRSGLALGLRRTAQVLRETAVARRKPGALDVAWYLRMSSVGRADSKDNHMPSNSIYLESGLWRREQSLECDPLRVFPELFNANATGRSAATENAEVAPEFEVAETADGFFLSARVPGITTAQLQVRVTPQLVIVARKQGPSTVSMSAAETNLPLPHAAFSRAFVLPTAVDARRLELTIVGDLLTIQLPKRTRVQTPAVAQKTR
jgi:HSP20 family molecular chaperone IbpA